MKASSRENIVTTRLGFKFNCPPEYSIERCIATQGEWEPHLRPVFDYFVRNGSICVDVGANSGFHALAMASRVGPTGKVIAFEPSSLHFNRLGANLRLNPGLTERVEKYSLGLGERTENLHVIHVEFTGNSYVSPSVPAGRLDPSVSPLPEACEIRPLDEILNGRRVDFLKIDVEGMELSVLKGAVRTIAAFRPVIVYETLLDCFDHEVLREIEVWFAERGYGLALSEPNTGLLVPTRYPRYHEDTIAYPRERALDFADFFFTSARYELLDSNETVMGGLCLCSAGSGEILARVESSSVRGDMSGWSVGERESWTYEFPTQPGSRLVFDTSEQITGTLQINEEICFGIKLVAGRFSSSLIWA